MPPPAVFECQGCGRDVAREPRRGRRLQSYCGRRECQRRRKALWQRQQLLVSVQYRADQKATQQLRGKKRPGYWREYRRRNPEKAEKNRVAQRERDRQRRGRPAEESAARTQPRSPTTGGREPLSAGRYVLASVGEKALESCEVVLVPVSEGTDVLATMDALMSGDRRL